jgi:CTP:molybdopterin cytidylyltransferase MocA
MVSPLVAAEFVDAAEVSEEAAELSDDMAALLSAGAVVAVAELSEAFEDPPEHPVMARATASAVNDVVIKRMGVSPKSLLDWLEAACTRPNCRPRAQLPAVAWMGSHRREGAGVSQIVYVVLASGSLTREGFASIFEPVEGRSPLSRVAEALGEREAFVVVPPERIDVACAQAPLALTIVNDQPDRGVSYALKVALSALPADRDFAILYGDVPLEAAMLERLERAFDGQSDVVYPQDGAGGGYPVIFAARARAAVEKLADGDTIDQARDHPSLRRVAVPA